MTHSTKLLAASIAAILSTTAVSSVSAGELRTAERPIEGQYIVVMKDTAAALAGEVQAAGAPRRASVSAASQNVAARSNAQVVKTFNTVLRGFVAKADDRALARLLADPAVAYVEEDGIVRISETQSNATWGIDRVDQRALPLNSSYTYDTKAATVHTYIVDTGVLSSHSEFSGRMANGFSAINDGRGTNDCNGHGTHVAGTVAGTRYGLAKQAKVHPVRVLGCDGSGSNSGVIAGMDWVAQNHVKPAVANMSLGGGVSEATDAAVQRMVNAGVTVVVAAGNDNDNACSYSPARAASAITVGSSTRSDERSSFSNYGRCVDIFAPGSDILSAWSNGGTNTISGTSMASPHVAGAAALYLATNPTATPAQVTSALISNSTPNRISDAKSGSPNRLLFSRFSGGGDDGGGGDGGGDGGNGGMPNGKPITGLSGSTGSSKVGTFVVPANARRVTFTMTGGGGDADMYVRFGSAPSTRIYDCRPYRTGNTEVCTFVARPGTYHVMLSGYRAYYGVTFTPKYE